MSTLDWLQSTPAAATVGWALLHFVWQGAVIAALVAIGFRLLRDANANTRYVLGCVGLMAMVIAPVVTTLVVTTVSTRGGVGTPGVAAAGGVVAASILDRIAPAVPTLTVGWLAGVLLFQVRLGRNWLHAQVLRRRGAQPTPAAWRAATAELAERLDVRVPVQVLVSALVPVPMMIGWLRPVVLVPTGALTGLTPAQLRSIIAHELTHVRRHDYLVNLVQAVVETVLFYHPAVWWLSGRIRVEREYCCDDVAVRVCGDALCYAQALAALETLRCDDLPAVLASTGGSLMDRIRRIAGVTPTPAGRPPRRIGGWLVPVLVTASATTLVSAMALAATTTPETDVEGDLELAPIERVDVVGITREIGADEAEMIALLREAGLDNEVLALVLEEIGADPRVLATIAHATEHEAYVAAHLESLRAGVAERLAAGHLTPAEAERHLELARQELAQRTRVHGRLRAMHPEAVRELETLHERVGAEVLAGRITEDEARRHLHEVGERVHAAQRRKAEQLRHEALRTRRPGPVDPEVFADLERAEVECHEVEAALHRAHEAGDVNAMDVRIRLDAARARLHELRAVVEARHAQADVLAQLELIGAETQALREREHALAELELMDREGRLLREHQHAARQMAHLRAIETEQAARHVHELARVREAEQARHADRLTRELTAVRESETRARHGAIAREHAAHLEALPPKHRQALRESLEAARQILELSAVEGRLSPEDAARRREHLARLQAALAEESREREHEHDEE